MSIRVKKLIVTIQHTLMELVQLKIRSESIHGPIFEYLDEERVWFHKKINLKCKLCEHVFEISLAQHTSGELRLNGKPKGGCPRCQRTEFADAKGLELQQRAAAIHHNKYDYSKSVYKGTNIPVTIICPTHGEFLQTFRNHVIHKQGCPACAGNQKSSKEEFIAKAVMKYGSEYDYSEVVYTNSITPVIIKHVVCGNKSKQRPGDHLYGKGCQYCFKNIGSSTDEFIRTANTKHHGIYDYSKTVYLNNSTDVIIICKIHGDFLQKPNNHISGRLSGCPKCAKQSFSQVGIKWLQEVSLLLNLQIQHAGNTGEYKVQLPSGKKYYIDGVYQDDLDRIAFEFHGDYWHGNPSVYDPNDVNPTNGKTFGQLYQETLDKEQALRDLGWYVVSIWETDFAGGVLLYPYDLYQFFLTSDPESIFRTTGIMFSR